MTAPECPYALGPAGTAWWSWAWSTQAASRWDDGALYVVARRAQLEDAWSAEQSNGLAREIRETDAQLGLSPKAALTMFGKPDEEKGGDDVDELARKRAKRQRARAAGA